MSKSQVYYIDRRVRFGHDMFSKLGKLLERAAFGEFICENELVAIKLHFGEGGTTAFIDPQYVRFVVQQVKSKGALPFLTDTNVVYKGRRNNSVDHINTAYEHGFSPLVTGAPLIISGGLRGQTSVKVDIGKKHYQSVELPSEIADIDKLVCLTHFTGHLAVGFGGATKNLGMGLSTKGSKLSMHSTVVPTLDDRKCIGCGVCCKHCPAEAISLVACRDGKGKIAVIDRGVCIGCGECIASCAKGAYDIEWNESAQNLQEKICEHAYGVVKSMGNVFFMNFLLNLTPGCDCFDHSDAPIVPDIGILASFDPVAIDQASIDLVNAERGIANTMLGENLEQGRDKFHALYPSIDWNVQLSYGQEIGLGSRDYELVEIWKGL